MLGYALKIGANNKALACFDISEHRSKGITIVSFTVDQKWSTFRIPVVTANVLVLICADFVNRIGIRFKNIQR